MKKNSVPTDTLTTGEVADACGVNFRTVIRWIERGILNAHRLPGRGDRRVERAELDRFMRERGFLPDSRGPEQRSDPNQTTGILIVDNDLELLSAMKTALKGAGHEVTGVGSGFEAGIELSRKHWSALILDLGMPDPDGFQILKKIQVSPELQIDAILAISGLGHEALDRARQLGAHQALEKPFSTKDLIRIVGELSSCRKKAS